MLPFKVNLTFISLGLYISSPYKIIKEMRIKKEKVDDEEEKDNDK